MKIALIAHLKYPIAEPFHGGLEMHTHLLCKELMGRGHDVTLFALENSDRDFNVVQPPLNAVEMGQGIDLFEENPGFGPNFVNKLHAYSSVMRQIAGGGYDLVHNNSLHFVPLSFVDTLPCPMVTVLHTPPFPSLQSAALLARNSARNHFVSVSDNLGGQWADYIDDYTVVYNGIQTWKWRFGAAPEPRTAAWVGRFCPEKGPEYAIRAARLAGYRLKLAGSIYDQKYFDAQIAPLLGDGIEYVGHLDHDQISALLGSAAVGLFSSTWDEPFGLVLAEMLACGTPIVSFDSGAAAEIIDAETGVLVPKRDTAAMAAAIPRAARLDRHACRQRAQRYFHVDAMISGYEALYERLVTLTAAPTPSSTRLTPVRSPAIGHPRTTITPAAVVAAPQELKPLSPNSCPLT